MQILNCTGCGKYEEKDEDVKSYTCGSCTCKGAARVQHEEEERLRPYEPARSKAARKSKKWTQSDLADILRIPVGHVSEFERGAGLIDPKHAAWLEEQK